MYNVFIDQLRYWHRKAISSLDSQLSLGRTKELSFNRPYDEPPSEILDLPLW